MEKKGIKKEVKMNFLIPESCNHPNEVNDLMKMAFQECKEAGLSPQWIKAEDSLTIPASKNVVFVLQEFDNGPIFTKLRSTKSLLCGPMCLRSCLAENKPIPDNKSPVFTAAMRDVVVTASQVSVKIKAIIKERVSFMGGVYMSNLSESVTHLVTDAVRSAKYEAAGESGIPIMRVEWVDAAWKESQIRNYKATDPKVITEYKCPIFHKMHIACSNLSKKEKEQIRELVTKNGGTFTPEMRQTETTLLVVREPRGEKYKHARSWDLPCVLPSYILESVEKGYAVPSKGHLVEPTVSCSTPTKEDDLANFTYNSDPSISVINFDPSKTHVDETQNTTCTQLGSQQRQPLRPSGNQYSQIMNSLSISDAKKAGSFVDGCKVFLSGFTSMEVEKLRRIVSLGGATVFSELTDSVSHVLLGEFVVEDMKAVTGLAHKPHVVSLEWLAASIKQRSPAAEEPFYCLETRRLVPEPPSPLSQKGVQLLKPALDESASKMPPPAEPPVSRKLFSEFLKENVKSPAKQEQKPPLNQSNQSATSTNTSSQDSVVPDLFAGKKFLIIGYDSEVTEQLEDAIETSGGCIVTANFKGVADYAVVPVDTPVPNVTALDVVTYVWLEDCIENKELMDIEYYHQPFSVDSDKKPLAGCCLSLSSYVGREKSFLMHLAQALGATYQDILAKVAKEDKGLLPSTHLVCPKPEGQKYKAASRWGLTIVNKDWLLACARSNTRVAVTNYVVTDENDSTTTERHIITPAKDGGRTPTSGVKETPRPMSSSKTEAFLGRSNPSSKPTVVIDAESICGPPATPSSGVAETSFQTPAVPYPALNSLKRKSSAMTPDDKSPFHMSTPESPYGQVIATPTADTKKRWKRFIDNYPSKTKSPPASPKPSRRQSTPLSELKRRIWAKAAETSDENINSNYSIEEMEDDPESEAKQQNFNPSMREDGTPLSTPIASKTDKSSSKDSENMRPRKVTVGRSTPTASDFKAPDGPCSSQTKSADPPTPTIVKKSAANENVCAMLGQLERRLSTSSQAAQEKPLPVLKVDFSNQPQPAAKKPVTSSVLDPESQPVLMGWEDPVEAAERAKVLNASSPVTNNHRKFVLSNVTERELYEEKLRCLGESVTTGLEYDKDTTHLIIDKPVRSEKLLCCLAAGRWVLHTSFIDRMMEMRGYVPEEEKYEWGNPANAGRVPSPNGEIEHQLAQAAYRWRKELNERSDKAFKGMKAMLFTNISKFESYRRLILAGGGTVLPNTMSSLASATHCFIDTNKVGSLALPLSEFIAHKVPCLPPLFLGEMLTKFPPPKAQDSLISDYKKLLDSTSH